MVSVPIVNVRSWLASFVRLFLDPTSCSSVLSAFSWSRRTARQFMTSAEHCDRRWRTPEALAGEALACSCVSSANDPECTPCLMHGWRQYCLRCKCKPAVLSLTYGVRSKLNRRDSHRHRLTAYHNKHCQQPFQRLPTSVISNDCEIQK